MNKICLNKKKTSLVGFVRVVRRRLFLNLLPFNFCVLKMFVLPDGASTMVLVTLQVKNVRHGPTQV